MELGEPTTAMEAALAYRVKQLEAENRALRDMNHIGPAAGAALQVADEVTMPTFPEKYEMLPVAGCQVQWSPLRSEFGVIVWGKPKGHQGIESKYYLPQVTTGMSGYELSRILGDMHRRTLIALGDEIQKLGAANRSPLK